VENLAAHYSFTRIIFMSRICLSRFIMSRFIMSRIFMSRLAFSVAPCRSQAKPQKLSLTYEQCWICHGGWGV